MGSSTAASASSIQRSMRACTHSTKAVSTSASHTLQRTLPSTHAHTSSQPCVGGCSAPSRTLCLCNTRYMRSCCHNHTMPPLHSNPPTAASRRHGQRPRPARLLQLKLLLERHQRPCALALLQQLPHVRAASVREALQPCQRGRRHLVRGQGGQARSSGAHRRFPSRELRHLQDRDAACMRNIPQHNAAAQACASLRRAPLVSASCTIGHITTIIPRRWLRLAGPQTAAHWH